MKIINHFWINVKYVERSNAFWKCLKHDWTKEYFNSGLFHQMICKQCFLDVKLKSSIIIQHMNKCFSSTPGKVVSTRFTKRGSDIT